MSEQLIALIERLEQEEGVNLISDDGGMWAVSGSGAQPVPEEGGFKETVSIGSIVEPHEWKPTILEALQYFFEQQDAP